MIGTSSKYALRALLALEKLGRDDFVNVQELSKKADVPKPYLSKIMKVLAKNDLVQTKKGLGGGVRLPRRKISFYDVCLALDDQTIHDNCFLAKTPCDDHNPCPYHRKWKEERKRIVKFLKEAKI